MDTHLLEITVVLKRERNTLADKADKSHCELSPFIILGPTTPPGYRLSTVTTTLKISGDNQPIHVILFRTLALRGL
jgi:hypothetical protein